MSLKFVTITIKNLQKITISLKQNCIYIFISLKYSWLHLCSNIMSLAQKRRFQILIGVCLLPLQTLNTENVQPEMSDQLEQNQLMAQRWIKVFPSCGWSNKGVSSSCKLFKWIRSICSEQKIYYSLIQHLLWYLRKVWEKSFRQHTLLYAKAHVSFIQLQKRSELYQLLYF